MLLFAGKMITAAYVPLPNYHQLFPDATKASQLLMPSSRTGLVWSPCYRHWPIFYHIIYPPCKFIFKIFQRFITDCNRCIVYAHKIVRLLLCAVMIFVNIFNCINSTCSHIVKAQQLFINKLSHLFIVSCDQLFLLPTTSELIEFCTYTRNCSSKSYKSIPAL